ncbi:MAG: hypothetical protein L3J53_08700 [Proteobacteria bacterium]|nr:hypothetical protein [Pseudomonadota bacterium]
MKKLITIIVILGILAAYPIWRYITHANVFARTVIEQASGIGEWSYASIHSSFNGKITIRSLSFTPNGYNQGFEIDSVTIATEPMFLLQSSAAELGYMLPESLSISVNTVVLNDKDNDVEVSLQNQSLWMLVAGYAGSFGCNIDSFDSFDDSSWNNIFSQEQIFNLDLLYSRQQNGSLDVDLVLDAESQFSSTWSGNLKSSYNDKQIVVNELIADKLFYSYLDNGFNLKRNNACKNNYNSSFATYQLSSGEHVQKYLRMFYAKELPKVLLSLYQRLLAPDVEFNVMISLNDRTYLSDIYNNTQRHLLESSIVEISTKQNEYIPIALTEIDYQTIDTDTVQAEKLAQEQWQAKRPLKVEKPQTAKEILKPKVFTMGKKKTYMIPIGKLSTVINKKVRLKTTTGLPVIGFLRSIKNNMVTIESKYKKGTAVLTIELSKITSVELMK